MTDDTLERLRSFAYACVFLGGAALVATHNTTHHTAGLCAGIVAFLGIFLLIVFGGG